MENMLCVVVVVVTLGLQNDRGMRRTRELGGVDGTIDGGSSGQVFRPRDFVKGNMCTMFDWVEKKVEPTTTTTTIFRHVGPPKVLCLFWENGPTLFTEHHEGEGGEANEDRQSHR